jgi:hypothetical protein
VSGERNADAHDDRARYGRHHDSEAHLAPPFPGAIARHVLVAGGVLRVPLTGPFDAPTP